MKQVLRITFLIGAGGLCGGCAFLPKGVDQAKIINDTVSSPAALVAIVAAVLAFLSGVLGPLVQVYVGRKQAAASQRSADAAMLSAKTAGAREIAKLRMAWMETLRNKLSEYHSILMNLENEDRQTDPETKTAEDRKLSELGTHLDLLLNHDPEFNQSNSRCSGTR
jgi:Tfp pilus assembly major pilin PilA